MQIHVYINSHFNEGGKLLHFFCTIFIVLFCNGVFYVMAEIKNTICNILPDNKTLDLSVLKVFAYKKHPMIPQIMGSIFNSLPQDKIFDQSKLKAFLQII